MANILDYLDAYGDVALDEMPFSPVDALVLCQLAYLDLDGIVPTGEASVSVKAASRAYFAAHAPEELYGRVGIVPPLTPFLLQKMARGARFSEARLGRFEEHFDRAAHCQFAAYTAKLADGTAFVAFRGTDDTLTGWREDFLLGAGEVPAQRDALVYLNAAGARIKGLLRVGGHSKGGNLAVYASAFCELQVQGRIVQVIDADGPGFIPQVLGRRELAPVKRRVLRMVPEFCVVGSLFHRDRPDLVVKSEGAGVGQHSALTWQVEGGEFACAEKVAPAAHHLDRVLDQWMHSLPVEERAVFVNEAFDAIERAGIDSFTEFATMSAAQLRRLVAATAELDTKSRRVVEELVVSLAGNAVEDTVRPFVRPAVPAENEAAGAPGTDVPGDPAGTSEADDAQEPSPEEMRAWRRRTSIRKRRMGALLLAGRLAADARVRGCALLAGGVALMASADSLQPLVPLAVVVACALHAASLLARYFREKRSGGADLVDMGIGAVLAAGAVVFLVFQGALTLTFNLIVGTAALAWGVWLLRGAVHTRAQEGHAPWYRWAWCAAAILVGVLVLLNPTQVVGPTTFAMGLFAAASGLIDLAHAFAAEAQSPGSRG